MRFHLLTVEGAQQFGQTWRIAPTVPLRSLSERGPKLMMPMSGEEVELQLPDGHVITAHIASFGIDAWKDSEGNLCIATDPANPSLTLTIRCDSDIEEVPPGTEIWQVNARFSSAADAS